MNWVNTGILMGIAVLMHFIDLKQTKYMMTLKNHTEVNPVARLIVQKLGVTFGLGLLKISLLIMMFSIIIYTSLVFSSYAWVMQDMLILTIVVEVGIVVQNHFQPFAPPKQVDTK